MYFFEIESVTMQLLPWYQTIFFDFTRFIEQHQTVHSCYRRTSPGWSSWFPVDVFLEILPFRVKRLCVPHVSSVFGSRGFKSAGPAIWNSLPLSVTTCSTIQTFKKQLQTHLFASSFPSSWIVLNAPLIRWSPLIYLSGCPWFCACLNVCYYYYYYYYDMPSHMIRGYLELILSSRSAITDQAF